MCERAHNIDECQRVARERESVTWAIVREEEQQLGLGSQPWVYTVEEEMLDEQNGYVPPKPVLPTVEKLETGLVQFAVPRGSREFTPRER